MTRFSSPDNIVSPFYRESLKFKNCFEFYPTFLQDSWYNWYVSTTIRFKIKYNFNLARYFPNKMLSLTSLFFFFKRETNHEGFNASAWFL